MPSRQPAGRQRYDNAFRRRLVATLPTKMPQRTRCVERGEVLGSVILTTRAPGGGASPTVLHGEQGTRPPETFAPVRGFPPWSRLDLCEFRTKRAKGRFRQTTRPSEAGVPRLATEPERVHKHREFLLSQTTVPSRDHSFSPVRAAPCPDAKLPASSNQMIYRTEWREMEWLQFRARSMRFRAGVSFALIC